MTLVLPDTNVFLRLAKPDHEHYEAAHRALFALASAGIAVGLVPQVCYEYYVVATRPRENGGLGLEPSGATHVLTFNVGDFKRYDRPAVLHPDDAPAFARSH